MQYHLLTIGCFEFVGMKSHEMWCNPKRNKVILWEFSPYLWEKWTDVGSSVGGHFWIETWENFDRNFWSKRMFIIYVGSDNSVVCAVLILKFSIGTSQIHNAFCDKSRFFILSLWYLPSIHRSWDFTKDPIWKHRRRVGILLAKQKARWISNLHWKLIEKLVDKDCELQSIKYKNIHNFGRRINYFIPENRLGKKGLHLSYSRLPL